MPRKKGSEKAAVIYSKPHSVDSFAALANELRLHESYKSLLLGIAVVFFVALLGAGFLKNRTTQNMDTKVIKQEVVMKGTKKAEVLGTHAVQAGEDLKTISIQYYETPDLFLSIAKANNIANPDIIDEGKNLTILKMEKKQLTPSLIPTVTDSISGTSYTVAEGDLLWNIAVRAYGDGYKWKDILTDNNLPSADSIFAGMILQLPR